MAAAHEHKNQRRGSFTRYRESVAYESEFNESSKDLQRMLADASGRSVTEPKRLIRKRPETSRSTSTHCQGGCRGFDPVSRSNHLSHL
jgi:hypothetical protein